MPTVADLERLQALTQRLIPLSQVSRGEPIEADDWNTLVGTVIEIARAVLAADHDQAVPAHEHPDQVSAGWLDPKLRALVERGPLSDPAIMARFNALEQKVDRLVNRIEAVNNDTKEVRDRVAEVSAKDLIRQADITNVRRVVDGLSDSRDSVLEVRETLRALQNDVGTAVEVGNRLTVDGQPVDMRSVLQRISGVEALRDRLRTPQGDILDASALENRLTQLTNTLVTQDTLDNTLKNFHPTIPQDQVDSIRGSLQTELLAQVNTSMGHFQDDIRNETNTRLGQVNDQINRSIADATPGITTSVLNTVRPEITSAVTASSTAASALIEKRVGETSTALRTEFNSNLQDVQTNITTALQTEVSRQVATQVAPISKSVQDLQTQVAPLLNRVGTLETNVATVATRVEQVAQNTTASQSALRQELLTTMDQRFAANKVDLDKRFADSDAATRVFVQNAIKDSRQSILDDARKIAVDTAKTEISIASNNLRGEMVGIAKDQVAASQDQLRGFIDASVTERFNTVPGLVANEVRRSTANLPDLVRVEVARSTSPGTGTGPILSGPVIGPVR